MNDEFSPTELTVEDIDNFLKKFEEDLLKPTAMTCCTSCSKEMAVILTDYYTGQCQQCVYDGKPWCTFSPVGDSYFMVTDDS